MNFKAASQGAVKAKVGMKSIDYFTQRPTLEADRGDREVITRDGRFRLSEDGELGRRELEKRLEQSSGEHLYRVVMSSGDVEMTAQETERWARNVLERNNIDNYMLVIHAGAQGHTDHPHAHVLIPAEKRFTVEDIRQLRVAGDMEQQQVAYTPRAMSIRQDYGDETNVSGKPGGKQPEREMENDGSQKKRTVDIQFGN
ncbi:hypothetical protein [Deinococcus arenicola]|uniref:Relaxase/mobilization nuclease domain-containing protein n=1 Tax=Deinococcus arenicola TaxID=2994950 RepID=A0ABU4DV40_9DEIO|nr:hypothetical protein [Deinococcus sp. ZS9-10]MDV6376302.1 hypothetical protein [Deinococcus sp. ZS9-10]